jgi:tetratricopeptide (TPR) repeat protein
MKKKFLVILFLVFCSALIAGEEQVIIAKANKAYTESYFANAVELYKKVIHSGYESPELYYNLGNSYFKLNEIPSAILYYEKARKLDPGNEDVNYNLAVANSKISDKIEPIPELFYKRWFRSLRELMSMDKWAKIGIITMIIALVSGFLYFVSNRMMLRKAGFWSGVCFLICALFCLFLAYQNFSILHNNKEAIILSPTVTIKSSPDEKSIDLFVLHEGTKVRVIDTIGNWFEIKIANGSVGWLPSSTVEKI